MDFARTTIHEHYIAIDLEVPDSYFEASRGWLGIQWVLWMRASNVTAAGNALREEHGGWRSQAAELFFQRVEATTASLNEWSRVAADNAATLLALGHAVLTARTDSEALWKEFHEKAAEALAEEKDNTWFQDVHGDIADWNGNRTDELLERYTHRSMDEVVHPLAQAYATARTVLGFPFGGPRNAAEPSPAAFAAAFGGMPGMPGAPGMPAGPPGAPSLPGVPPGGAGAVPEALGPPPVPRNFADPAALPDRPEAPASGDRLAGLAGRATPEAPPRPALPPPLPALPPLPASSNGGLVAPISLTAAAAGIGSRPPAPVFPSGPIGGGRTSAAPGTLTSFTGRPSGGGVPGLSTDLQGRSGSPGAPPPFPPPPRRDPTPKLPGRGTGAGGPASPAGFPGQPGQPGRSGGPGAPALPGRGGPGTPGFPGTGRPAPGSGPSSGRPGTGGPASPNASTGAPRALQGIRRPSATGARGVPSAEARTAIPPELGGRSQPARPGAPETAETMRQALRRGLEGRGEAGQGTARSLGTSGRPGTGSSGPRSGQPPSRRDETSGGANASDGRAAAERVGDEELFTNDHAAPAVIDPPELRGPVKRAGPALGPSR